MKTQVPELTVSLLKIIRTLYHKRFLNLTKITPARTDARTM